MLTPRTRKQQISCAHHNHTCTVSQPHLHKYTQESPYCFPLKYQGPMMLDLRSLCLIHTGQEVKQLHLKKKKNAKHICPYTSNLMLHLEIGITNSIKSHQNSIMQQNILIFYKIHQPTLNALLKSQMFLKKVFHNFLSI